MPKAEEKIEVKQVTLPNMKEPIYVQTNPPAESKEDKLSRLMAFEGIDPMQQILRHQTVVEDDGLYVPRSERLARAKKKILNPETFEKTWFVYTYVGANYAEPFELAAFAMAYFIKKKISEEFRKDTIGPDDVVRQKVAAYLGKMYERWFPKDGWKKAFLERTEEMKKAQVVIQSPMQDFLLDSAIDYLSFAELIRMEAATHGVPGPYPSIFSIWDTFETKEDAEEYMKQIALMKGIDTDKIAVGTTGCYHYSNPKYKGVKQDFAQSDIEGFYQKIRRHEETDRSIFLQRAAEKNAETAKKK